MTEGNGPCGHRDRAARGIGAATALRLAQDGFAVAVLDLDEAAAKGTVEAIEAAGGRALAVGADVSDADQVDAAVTRIASELGAPTVLVNNAGVLRDNMLFKMSDSDWDIVMNVHQGALPHDPRGAEVHDRGQVGPDRQPVEHVGPGQPRPGQLLDGQGRAAGLHQDPGHRARQVRGHRQRDRAGLHPDRR